MLRDHTPKAKSKGAKWEAAPVITHVFMFSNVVIVVLYSSLQVDQ
jgi:hypothetical protein